MRKPVVASVGDRRGALTVRQLHLVVSRVEAQPPVEPLGAEPDLVVVSVSGGTSAGCGRIWYGCPGTATVLGTENAPERNAFDVVT